MSPAGGRVGTIGGVHRRSVADSAWLVVDTTTGVAVESARAGWRIGGALTRVLLPLKDLVARPPLVPERYRPAYVLGGLAAEGHHLREVVMQAARRLVQRSVPVATAEILDQLDLTDLIRERVDLIGLARYVAAGLRLPESLRNSTASLTSDAPLTSNAVQPTELDDAAADQALAEWVDRVFRPRRPADDDPDEPTQPGSAEQGTEPE